MKKFVTRCERVLVALVLNPRLRPVEHSVAVRLAKGIALRWGLSSAALALGLEVIDRVVS